MKLINFSVIAFLIIGLTACGNDEVSWNTQEQQRAVALENSTYNAKFFRSKNKQYSGFNIMNRGDSTISSKCANGDGWSSVDLVSSDQKRSVKLKCSTASPTIGCLTSGDFSTRSYANQDGTCNRDLPVPMPKIVK